MKRFMWLATLSFVLLMPFGMHVRAQPEEVTESVTGTPHPPEQVRADLGRIGIVSACFRPEVTFEVPARSAHRGAAAWEGAKAGADLSIYYGSKTQTPEGVILGMIAAPYAAVVGGIVGAIKGKASEELKQEEDGFKGYLAALNFQETMRERVLSVARERTQYPSVPLEVQGPKTPDEDVTYDPLSCKDVDTVLEIGVSKCVLSGNQYPLRLVMAVGTRFIRIKDGKVLYSHNFTYENNSAWPYTDGIDPGFQFLAEKIVEAVLSQEDRVQKPRHESNPQ